MNAHLMLSAPYKTYLDNLLSAWPDLAFTLYQDGPEFVCALAAMDSAGTALSIHCGAGTPDMAFLLAYATFGMNLGIW